MYTKIQKWGNSQGVRIPKFILELSNFDENEQIEMVADENSIIIKKASIKRQHKTLAERFEGYTGEYKCEEYDWGKPVGNEVW